MSRTWAWQVMQQRYFAGLINSGVAALPCSICGKLVDINKAGKEPDSRSLDHHIPVSRGGGMLDARNLRCCHYRCNQSKNNRAAKQREPAPSRAW